ncbi:MAG: Peptidase family [Mucilaginibacter sp.]|nr:Peptidase family [Mucilaginibacter sp.]
MRYKKWLFIIIWPFLSGKICFAQIRLTELTPAVKAEIVDSLSSALLKKYIYLDTAVKMSNHIKEQFKSGVYNKINDPDALAQALNGDLNAIYSDLHMRIYYDSGFEKSLRTKSYMESVTRQMQITQEEKQKNYGFSKVEILEGNISYILINQFYDVNEQSASVIRSAFFFLKNTNALIIDLRENGGGDPDMVKYICSYFFEEKTHLNDYYERWNNKITQYNTVQIPNSSFTLVPICVLTSRRTYSAAEEFSYDLQSLHRATIVGETTGGAAHWTSSNSISNGFIANIPFKRAINPITGKNWEKIGVKPNIKSDSECALSSALLNSYDYLINNSKDSSVIKSAKWFRIIVNSKLHPVKITPAKLKNFIGNYEERLITLKNHQLYFTDVNGYKISLNPVSQTAFTFTNNNRQIKFHKDRRGKTYALDFKYENGKIEQHLRKN